MFEYSYFVLLFRLKRVYSKRTGKRESNGGLEERQTPSKPANGRKRKRKAGESEEDDDDEDDSDEQGEEDEEDYGGKRGKKADACEDEVSVICLQYKQFISNINKEVNYENVSLVSMSFL